jgi:hypothetical protein
VTVLLALVEYARATDDGDAMRRANETFALIDERFHDSTFGGWNENFTRDSRPGSTSWRPSPSLPI